MATNHQRIPIAIRTKNYVDQRNIIPTECSKESKQNGENLPDTFTKSPLSRFSRREVKLNLKYFHSFGSPVYVLQKPLQQNASFNKWSDKSRVWIFFCHSPPHSASVPLVLNTNIGLVIPRFRCIYDDDFFTCKRDAKFTSSCQYKANASYSHNHRNFSNSLMCTFSPNTTCYTLGRQHLHASKLGSKIISLFI